MDQELGKRRWASAEAVAPSLTGWARCATGCRATCFKFWHGRCWTILTRIPLNSTELNIFNSLSLALCELWQFDGLLNSKDLTCHLPFADSTFSRAHLSLLWSEVQTGKAMDINLYTVLNSAREGAQESSHTTSEKRMSAVRLRIGLSWTRVPSRHLFPCTMLRRRWQPRQMCRRRGQDTFFDTRFVTLGVSGSCLRGSGGVHSRWPSLVQRRHHAHNRRDD